MDWRTIEAALVEIARTYRLELAEDHSSDTVVAIDAMLYNHGGDEGSSYIGPPLNLTEIAKELAERLGSKA